MSLQERAYSWCNRCGALVFGDINHPCDKCGNHDLEHFAVDIELVNLHSRIAELEADLATAKKCNGCLCGQLKGEEFDCCLPEPCGFDNRIAELQEFARWRKVEEELPEVKKVVWVLDYKRNVWQAEMLLNRQFYSEETQHELYTVTHWMPIPPLPQKGEDDV